MFAVVDYRMGNLKSVERGLRAAGADARITADAREIAAADAVVLPGVGAFADAMASMHDLGEDDAIRSAIADGKPFLGICLGLHLLFSDGVEGAPAGGTVAGLGLVPGTVERIPRHDAAGRSYKVPHVGWNSVEAPLALSDEASLAVGGGSTRSSARRESASGAFAKAGLFEHGTAPHRPRGNPPSPVDELPTELFAGVPAGEFFYFTHSYMAPESPFTIAQTEHSVRFPSAVAISDRVFGVQFHPEKSSDAGARVLANFVRIAKAVESAR